MQDALRQMQSMAYRTSEFLLRKCGQNICADCRHFLPRRQLDQQVCGTCCSLISSAHLKTANADFYYFGNEIIPRFAEATDCQSNKCHALRLPRKGRAKRHQIKCYYLGDYLIAEVINSGRAAVGQRPWADWKVCRGAASRSRGESSPHRWKRLLLFHRVSYKMARLRGRRRWRSNPAGAGGALSPFLSLLQYMRKAPHMLSRRGGQRAVCRLRGGPEKRGDPCGGKTGWKKRSYADREERLKIADLRRRKR